MAFVVPRTIDQLNDIVDLAVGSGAKDVRLGPVLQLIRKLVEQR
jgi:hypothetical protein